MVRATGEKTDTELRIERQQAAQSLTVQRSTATVGSLPDSGIGGDGTRVFRASTPGSQKGELFVEAETNWVKRWTGTEWVYHSGIMIDTDANRGAITVDSSDVGAPAYATNTAKIWYVDSAPAWIHLPLYDLPDVGTGYRVAGTRVVGAQQAAVTSPAGGATIDTQARTAIDAIRAVLAAHGLTL